MSEQRLLILGCGILKKEIHFLIQKNSWPVDTFFLDSMLHIDFSQLSAALNASLAHHSGRQILVFYGACHPQMEQMLAAAGVTRTAGQNCLEMLLGEELFTKELSGGAFFLLEEWAIRWNVVIEKTFGSNVDVTRMIFQGDRNYLLGVRTPLSGDFSAVAAAASNQIALPIRWLDVSLDVFEQHLSRSITAVYGNMP